MLLLLKSTRNIAEVQTIFSWCVQRGFRIERSGGGPRPITPDMLQADEPLSSVGAVEWGNFRTRIEAGPELTELITLRCGPELRPPSLPLEHVGALISGDWEDDSFDDLRKAGGEIHQTLGSHTNLLILGHDPDLELVERARGTGSILIWEKDRYDRLKRQLKEEWALDSHGLNQELRSELRHRSRPLRVALKTRDPVAVDSAVDLFLSDAHGAMVDALLDGVDWNPGQNLRAGQLIPNSFFSGTGPATPTMERALRRIIAKAPSSARRTHQLVQRIKSLRVEGEGWLDCSTLSAFTALEWIQIAPRPSKTGDDAPRLKTTGLKGLIQLPQLRCLELTRLNMIQLADLPLDGLSQLQRLSLISCPIQNIQGITWLSNLEFLRIGVREGGGWTDLETIPLFEVEELAHLTHLSELSLHRVQINRLPSIPSLTSLELGLLPDLKLLEIANQPALKKIHVRSHVLQQAAFSGLPLLTELRVESGALKRLDCTGIDTLTSLRAGDFGLHPRPVLKHIDLGEGPELAELDLSGLGMDRWAVPPLPALTNLKIQAPSKSNRPGLRLNLQSLRDLEDVELAGRFKLLQFGETTKLKKLSLQGSLEQDLILETCPELELLYIRGARDATGPRKIRIHELPRLREVQLGGGGPEIVEFGQLPQLQRAVLGAPGQPAARLHQVNFEHQLSRLRFLLIRAPQFEGPEGKNRFPRLQILDLSGCTSVRTLDWVSQQTRLRALHARGCELLEDVRGIVSLPELVQLDFRACDILRPIPKPSRMENRDEVVEFKKKIARSKTRTLTSKKRPSNHALQSGLRRAMRSRDPEATVEAIEALRKARSAEAMSGLLEGLEMSHVAQSLDLFASELIEEGADQPLVQAALWQKLDQTEKTIGPQRVRLIHPNRNFEGKSETQSLRSWALVKVLAMVPRSCEEAHLVRDSITGIHLSECPDGHLPRLASFGQLRTLSIGPSIGETRPQTQIEDLEPLGSLSGLRELRLQREYSLESLQGIESLQLEALVIHDCPSLENLRGLGWQTAMEQLVIEAAIEQGLTFDRLEDLSPLRGLKALKSLRMIGLTQVQEIKALTDLENLNELSIHGAVQVQSLAPLQHLSTLESASLCGLHALQSLEGLTGLSKLKSLNMAHCHGLKTTQGLESLTALETLDLHGCEGLKELRLQHLPALRTLDMTGCVQLNEVFALKEVPDLERLMLSPRRDTLLDGISHCPKLRQLSLSGEGVEDVDFLEDLPNLETLTLQLASAGDLSGLSLASGLQRIHVSDILEDATRAALASNHQVQIIVTKSDH